MILRNCNGRPRWWSLDFWVNPDAQDRIEVANLPSGGTREGIARLFKAPKDPAHVDLAIIQDGLIVDGDLAALDVAQADQIQGLVHLYRSVFCAFARRGFAYPTFAAMRGHEVRAYLGQQGSGVRYLSLRLLRQLGIEVQDVHDEWSPDQVARAMTSDLPGAPEIDVAFTLDRIDSGVIRRFVESGRFDLVSLDEAEDLFRTDEVLRASTTIRPITLARGGLSVHDGVPSHPVTTIETQTILACTAVLADWDAYRITRTLTEHFKELGLGADAVAQVPQSDPGSGFDYPIHPGAARYYRSNGTAEAFPYQVLVVAIGASIALTAYWHSQVLKRRADRMTRRIDEILLVHRDDPERIARDLAAVKVRAVLGFKEGRLNKEGYERVNEYVSMFHRVMEEPAWAGPSMRLTRRVTGDDHGPVLRPARSDAPRFGGWGRRSRQPAKHIGLCSAKGDASPGSRRRPAAAPGTAGGRTTSTPAGGHASFAKVCSPPGRATPREKGAGPAPRLTTGLERGSFRPARAYHAR